MKTLPILPLGLLSAIAVLFFSCNNNGTGPGNGPNNGNVAGGGWVLEEYACASELADNREDLGMDSAIVITFNGSGAPTVRNPISSFIPVVDTSGHVIIGPHAMYNGEGPVNIVVSGPVSDGSLKIYGTFPMGGLYLNGVNITNPRGPAINIQGRMNSGISVHLVGGCGRENYLKDGFDYAPTGTENAKGTFYSRSRLTFLGSGLLEVWALGRRRNDNDAHAIVVDGDLRIESGNFIIRESVNDGFHANNNITITGGTLQIMSTGDAIQNEDSTRTIQITGGKIRARTTGIRSHGIASENNVIIGENADIKIEASGPAGKGIRARGHVDITGNSNIGITVTGARILDDSDSGRASGVKARSLEMAGGTMAINALNAIRGRGINTDGDVMIRNGSAVTIHTHGDGINVNGYFRMRDAATTVTSRSRDAQDIDCGDRHDISGGGTLNAVLNGRQAGGF